MQEQQLAEDLPERLALPLQTGEPWWYWLGGRPALDLVNTLRERWRRRVETLATPPHPELWLRGVETLVTPADLELWLGRSGVVADPGPLAATPPVLEEARALREAIDACVTALLDATPSPPPAVALIDSWLVHAGTRPQLGLDPAGV